MQVAFALNMKDARCEGYKLQEPIGILSDEASISLLRASNDPNLKPKIFYDLKLKDSPPTMARRIRRLIEMGVHGVSVWIDEEGLPMVRKMLVDNPDLAPYVCGVTVLTTVSEAECTEIHHMSRTAFLLQQSAPAAKVKMTSFVCAVNEAAAIRQQLGEMGCRAETLCPAIRIPEDDPGGQEMVATPRQARDAKASWIIVERPITDASDPRISYRRYKNAL